MWQSSSTETLPLGKPASQGEGLPEWTRRRPGSCAAHAAVSPSPGLFPGVQGVEMPREVGGPGQAGGSYKQVLPTFPRLMVQPGWPTAPGQGTEELGSVGARTQRAAKEQGQEGTPDAAKNPSKARPGPRRAPGSEASLEQTSMGAQVWSYLWEASWGRRPCPQKPLRPTHASGRAWPLLAPGSI